MKPLYQMFAHYNQWANGRVFEAVDALAGAVYRSEEGAAFGSIHRTLNHLLAADRIWLNRLTGEGSAPTRLDAILYEDRASLRMERAATDAVIVAYVGRLDEDAFEGTFTYTPITNPKPVTQRLGPVLSHFFNHQTHHRGQVHALLTRLAGKAPALDLIYYQRESGEGF